MFHIYPTKITHHVELINPQEDTSDTSDGPVSSISVQRYVRHCCISHLSQPGVKIVLKKIDHKPSGG